MRTAFQLYSNSKLFQKLYLYTSIRAERERPICRSPLRPTFVTPALCSAPAPRPSDSRSAPAHPIFRQLRSRYDPNTWSKTFYSSVFTVGLGLMVERNKKAQLSLTNQRDAKACQKLLQLDVLTTLSLTILAYLHAFTCCCVRNLRNPEKFTENSNLWSSRSSILVPIESPYVTCY